ncbi:MAG: hypothetical protein KC912_05125 [Proteobacteria bacterium]|nr:hypothetical protein [Pseudomonadota bacterium]
MAQMYTAGRSGISSDHTSRRAIRQLTPLLLIPWATAAFAFPAEGEWRTLSLGADVVADGAGDASPDLIGASDQPGGYWYADASSVFFRLRVTSSAPATDVLGVLVSVDGDAETLELAVVADGPGDAVAVYTANGVAGSSPQWTLDATVGALSTMTEMASGLVAIEVPRGALEGAGWAADAGASFWFAGGSAMGTWTDLHGCADLACAPQDILTSPVYIDQDLDGLTNPIERALGLPWNDADADDDGVLDGDELRGDGPDGDGLVDALDCDSDNDSLRDGLELGVTDAHEDTDLDNNCFVADADSSSVTDPRSHDTDGGGLADAIEDVNRDGAVDAWETDPTSPGDDVDTDGDGISDTLELLGADGNIDDVDSDGDGVSDAAEWLWDIDDDGVPAFQDDDADGDGFTDIEEGEVDTDGDGRVDAIDTNSDGDARPDAEEGRSDLDCDGVENRLDANDFDGFCDTADVADGFEDEDVSRPAGDLGKRCAHGSAGFWLALVVPTFMRRRRAR